MVHRILFRLHQRPFFVFPGLGHPPRLNYSRSGIGRIRSLSGSSVTTAIVSTTGSAATCIYACSRSSGRRRSAPASICNT